MPGTPLPNTASPEVQRLAYEEPDSFSAYRTCLRFLATTERVRFVRILGYLLIHAPNRAVRVKVANCIHSPNDQSNLTDLGAFSNVLS